MRKRLPHILAVLQALFVAFLWSVSMVLVKIGLEVFPPFTFAGLRYGLAFLCLLLFTLRPTHRRHLRSLSARDWQRLTVLGLLFYAVTQGTAYFGLRYSMPATVSLLFNFSPIVVALLGVFLLAERPTPFQWGGVLANIVGVVIYFYPMSLPAEQVIGLLVMTVGVIANAGSSILGRRINREGNIPALVVTTISMGVGAVVLLVTGVLTEDFPRLTLGHWAIIGWLAVVHTAFAFTLWNHTQRTLSAVESSIINNTMLIQVAVLAWLLMDVALTQQQIVGLALAGAGALLVQLRRLLDRADRHHQEA